VQRHRAGRVSGVEIDDADQFNNGVGTAAASAHQLTGDRYPVRFGADELVPNTARWTRERRGWRYHQGLNVGHPAQGKLGQAVLAN
jgi:hypothetical protein